MPLPDSFLQELVSRNNIEDVVSSYVRIKRRGRTSVGLCPFHGGENALLHRLSGNRILLLLRLRSGRRRDYLY